MCGRPEKAANLQKSSPHCIETHGSWRYQCLDLDEAILIDLKKNQGSEFPGLWHATRFTTDNTPTVLTLADTSHYSASFYPAITF
jgi:hypothetical protein